jgi:MFS transporter, putative metabolite:H+ symporter
MAPVFLAHRADDESVLPGDGVRAVVTGNYADRFGRRRLIALSAVLQVAVKVAFSAVAGVASMYAVRFAVGFCFGFSLPLTTSMIAEITPIEYRGKMLVIINFFLTLGKVLGCFLVYIFISPDLKSGNWRLMMITSGIIPLIVLYGSLTFILESPRFLLSVGQIDQAAEVIDKILLTNNKGKLEEKDRQMLQL